MVVVAGLTSHANTGTVKTGRTIFSWRQLDRQKASPPCFPPMPFHLNIYGTTNLLQQRPIASINIHKWTTYSYSCLSFWVHALYRFVVSLHQIWYPKLSVTMFISRPYFKPQVISFRGICVTTKLLQQTNSLNNIHRWITLNTWTFTLMSVFLSACSIPICVITLPYLILIASSCTCVRSYT